jgi:FixJ family two-component response regulator
MSVAAMKAGAVDFLTKPFRDQDLLDAIQRGIRLDRERRAEAGQLVALRQRYETLTPREREVMALVAEGLANKQIAAALDLREVTVKVHRAQVMRKLEARSLPELARIADRLKAILSAQPG